MLINLLQLHCAALAAGGDWNGCAARLRAESIEVRDKSPVTYGRMTEAFGDSVRELVAATVRAVAASASPFAGEVSDAHLVLLGAGLQIDTDSRQAVIDQLAAAGTWPPDVTAQIKSLGVRRESLAQQAGLSFAECGPAECQRAWLSSQVAAWFSAQSAVIVEDLAAGTITTKQQVIDRLARAI